MASLARSRSVVNAKTNEFLTKSDDIRSELHDRSSLINHTESAITMMLELVHLLNQLNNEHAQDLSLVKTDFDRKHQEFTDLSQNVKHDWDIKKEVEQIRTLENEKNQAQKDLLDQTLLLEDLKTVLGKAIAS
jgi:methyl-accepting chemotaxis protein